LEAELEIKIDWQKPIAIAMDNEPLYSENNMPDELVDAPGVYFFARWYGEKITPFYIGQSITLRERLRQHFQGKIMWAILEGRPVTVHGDREFDVGKGPRYFHYGYFRAKPGQQAKTCIDIVEKQKIRQAVLERLQILNRQGTTIETHTILFEGYPKGFSGFAKHSEIEA
jgi:hypothetical protein